MSTVDLKHMKIRLAPVKELLPYARNSRTHTEEQIKLVAASITEFGWTNPILTDGKNGLIAGHCRLAAAQRLGLVKVPVIDLSHLTEAQKRAYVISDNQIANYGTGWDAEMLRVELEELEAADFNMGLLGFEESELDAILNPEVGEVQEGNDDEAPALPEVAFSQPGDCWVMGPHRVLCGDATSIDAWDALMQGELADLCITDPPYNVAYESKLAGGIANDDMADGQFRQFLRDAFTGLYAVMKAGASIYVYHADTEGYNFRGAFLDAGFHLSGCLIWKKNSLVLGRSPYQWIHEPCLFGFKKGAAHQFFGGRKQVTVQDYGGEVFSQREDGSWVIEVGGQVLVVSGEARVEGFEPTVIYHDKPSRSAMHPTMKPVGLLLRNIRNSARKNDIVVDAFGGSGSTLIAAERAGLCARVMELDARFVDVICLRYFVLTGRAPVHAATGEAFPVEERLDARFKAGADAG